MGTSQSNTSSGGGVPRRSSSLRVPHRPSSADSRQGTPRSTSMRVTANLREPRGRSGRPRGRRERSRGSGASSSSQSSSANSSPDMLPPPNIIQRLRRLNLDEDYDFITFGRSGGSSLSMSAPAHPLALLRHLSRMKCPLCSQLVCIDELEVHMSTCLTKPRVRYNVDFMSSQGGECAICLEDLEIGHSIARLPCLCVYHVTCLEMWYKRSQTCPAHPESVPSGSLSDLVSGTGPPPPLPEKGISKDRGVDTSEGGGVALAAMDTQ